MGEGPYYEEATGELRFVDIIKKEIHSVNLAEGPNSHKVTKLEHSVGYVRGLNRIFYNYIPVILCAERARFADVVNVGCLYSITADIEGHEGEYIVAAKLGFAIFDKSTGQLRYIKKVYDDPTNAERFAS